MSDLRRLGAVGQQRLVGRAGRAARRVQMKSASPVGDGEPGRADDRVDGIGELQLRVMVLAHGVAPGLDDRRQDVVGEISGANGKFRSSIGLFVSSRLISARAC